MCTFNQIVLTEQLQDRELERFWMACMPHYILALEAND